MHWIITSGNRHTMTTRRRSEPSKENNVTANRIQKDNSAMRKHLLVLHNKAGTVTAVEIPVISQTIVTRGVPLLDQNGGLIRRSNTTKSVRTMVMEMTMTTTIMPMVMATMEVDLVMGQGLMPDQETVEVSGEITSTRGLCPVKSATLQSLTMKSSSLRSKLLST